MELLEDLNSAFVSQQAATGGNKKGVTSTVFHSGSNSSTGGVSSMDRVFRLMLQMAPVSAIMSCLKSFPDWPSISMQDAICEKLRDKLVLAHPLSKRWTKGLLKAVEQSVSESIASQDIFSDDSIQVDVYADSLVEMMVFLHSAKLDEDDAAFVTYFNMNNCSSHDSVVGSDSDSAETIIGRSNRDSSRKSSRNSSYNLVRMRILRLHNQVGMTIWEAGIMLGELFVRMSNAAGVFSGKRVIELGAGVGITGLILGRLLLPSDSCDTVVLTDFHDLVCENMQYNVDINSNSRNCSSHKTTQGSDEIESERNESSRISDTVVEKDKKDKREDKEEAAGRETTILVDQVDWSTVQESYFEQYDADILYAADCTYSEDINVHLVTTFKKFLVVRSKKQSTLKSSSSGSGSNSDCTTAIATICSGTVTVEQISQLRACIDLASLCTIFAKASTPYILIACTLRNPITLQHFVDTVQATEDLVLIDATAMGAAHMPVGDTFYHFNNRDSIKLYCICLLRRM